MAPKKLPLASRIKRMMQADEDVGKVAGSAPVVASRALELFIHQLVRTTSDVALMHGAKLITKQHLKGAIVMVPEAFDFLSDVVHDVEDLPPAPDLTALLQRELDAKARERETSGTASAGKKRKTTSGRRKVKDENEHALGDLASEGNLGDLGDIGDGEVKGKKPSTKDGRARQRSAPRKRAPAAKRGKKERKKKVESDDDEEFDEDEEDTEDDFDEATYEAPPVVTRTGRRVKVRKSYVEEEDDDDDEPEARPARPKATLEPMGNIGDDEDDYDEDE